MGFHRWDSTPTDSDGGYVGKVQILRNYLFMTIPPSQTSHKNTHKAHISSAAAVFHGNHDPLDILQYLQHRCNPLCCLSLRFYSCWCWPRGRFLLLSKEMGLFIEPMSHINCHYSFPH